MYSPKLKFMYRTKAIKVYCLKLVLKNPHNFFLEKTFKLKENLQNFRRNFISNLIFFYPLAIFKLGSI